MVKNGAHGRPAKLAGARRHWMCREVASTFTQGLPVVFHCNFLHIGQKSLPLCIGNTCKLVHLEVHATVLHGDGLFNARWPPLRHKVCG